MTQLRVSTLFGDVSELASGFAHRVDEERIMLSAPMPFDEGESVAFVVHLADGTIALEGSGRVQQILENGDDFPQDERFDIVFEGLEWKGSSQVVYERILLARAGTTEGRPTGNAAVVEEVSASVVQPLPPDPVETDVWGTEVATSELSVVDVRGAPKDPRVVQAEIIRAHEEERPSPVLEPVATPSERVPPPALTRLSKPPSWAPEMPARPSRRPSLGLHEYGKGQLPIPRQVPRPQVDDALKIAPAPRPNRV